MVRGEFMLESNAIENLSVRIDGIIYGIPADSFGRTPVKFPDPLSSSVPAPVFTSEPVPVRPVGSVSTAAASVTAMPPTPPRVNVPARDAVAPS